MVKHQKCNLFDRRRRCLWCRLRLGTTRQKAGQEPESERHHEQHQGAQADYHTRVADGLAAELTRAGPTSGEPAAAAILDSEAGLVH